MERNSAAQALAAVAEGRAALADRLYTPWWYHPVLGLLVGSVVVASGVLHEQRLWFALACLFGSLALTHVYRRLTGIDLLGPGAGDAMKATRPRLLTLALMAIVLACLIASMAAGAFGHDWAAWLAGAVTVVAMVLMGRRYDEALRHEIRTRA